MNRTTLGALIGAVFGSLWAIVGAGGLPAGMQSPAMLIAAFVTVLIAAYALVRPQTHAGRNPFDRKAYGISVAAEIAAILLAVVLLRALGRSDLLLPAIGLIVGLHFIGMWKATNLPPFLAIAAAMSAVSLIAFFLPGPLGNAFNPRQVTVGFGCALVLWTASALFR